MKVGIHANQLDKSMLEIGYKLRPILDELAKQLSGDYGGIIEHLWIDLELSEMTIKAFKKPPYPFRFQKRVAGRSHFGLPDVPDSYNVGHYSVRPDFSKLRKFSLNQCVKYCVKLIYESTTILIEKQKKLNGFDALRFREQFKIISKNMGYDLDAIEL